MLFSLDNAVVLVVTIIMVVTTVRVTAMVTMVMGTMVMAAAMGFQTHLSLT